VPSRYAGTSTATLNWNATASGKRLITVEVDPANQVQESRKDNNVLSVTVDFGSVNLALGNASWQVEQGPLRPGEATRVRLNPVTVTVTQPDRPAAGLAVAPPSYRATWYDGDPGAGGSVIGRHTQPGAGRFDACQAIPAQAWTGLMTSPRSFWLVVEMEGSGAETSLEDNRVVLTLPAITDLTLVQAQQMSVPLAGPDTSVSVPLRFQVANLGTVAPAGQVHVGLWPGTEMTGPAFGQVKLDTAGNWTAPLVWTGLEVGGHLFIARVDPDNVIAESNEANNDLMGTAVVARHRFYIPTGFGGEPRRTYVALPTMPATCWQ
jgi:hypothetical protein